jgi:hypothetical protein
MLAVLGIVPVGCKQNEKVLKARQRQGTQDDESDRIMEFSLTIQS